MEMLEIAEYLRPSFRLAAALETLRLSSSVQWQRGLYRASSLVRPDFMPYECTRVLDAPAGLADLWLTTARVA
jgi:hypothetical protein